jgi:hypothetical protein
MNRPAYYRVSFSYNFFHGNKAGNLFVDFRILIDSSDTVGKLLIIKVVSYYGSLLKHGKRNLVICRLTAKWSCISQKLQ